MLCWTELNSSGAVFIQTLPFISIKYRGIKYSHVECVVREKIYKYFDFIDQL